MEAFVEKFGATGVLSVLCTPFDERGTIDFESLDRLMEQHRQWNVDGVVLFGLAGEGYKLTDAERGEVIRAVIEQAGTLAVVVSTEHTGSEAAGARTAEAVKLGASAIMAYPPSLVKADDAGIIEYYQNLADAGAPAIVVQDAPAWTGTPLSTDLLARLASTLAVPVAVKVEVSPTAPKIEALRGLGIPSIGGYGALHLMEEMECGIVATMPGCGLPGLYRALWDSAENHGGDLAWPLYGAALPVLSFQMGSIDLFVACQKRLLHRAGIFRTTYQRGPRATFSERQGRWFDELVARGGLEQFARPAPQS